MKQRKKWAKWQQLELRFSQRSDDHTPDINNTNIYPDPNAKLPAEGDPWERCPIGVELSSIGISIYHDHIENCSQCYKGVFGGLN